VTKNVSLVTNNVTGDKKCHFSIRYKKSYHTKLIAVVASTTYMLYF